MKKLLTILFSVLLTANFLSCGGGDGGSTSTGTTGKTKVTINLGETRTVSSGSLNSKSSIPAAIARIRFTISAPDMETIVREVAVSGSTSISETFEVPMGSNRHFLIEALDADGNVLFQGGMYADLTGASVDLTIAMISVEGIAPVFSGLTGIDSVTTTSMVLSWSPATDNVTPSERIQYLIYISATPGGQNFLSPNFVTAIGATSHTITGLNPNTTYYIVVRGMDERGNVDGNNAEKSAQTLIPPDITPPAFGGIVAANALSETEISLSWDPASDDRTSAADITYLIYMATSSHGQNLSIPSFTITGTTSRIVSGLNPGATYYFIVRSKDEAGNIDSNTVEMSATTLIPPDITPPAFGGIVSAIALSETEIDLSWDPASDDHSSAANITYLIYTATSSHGQNLSVPSFTITGTTSRIVTGLNPGTTYYFIVRAKDEAGNIDSNTVEMSAMTLSLPFIDLWPGLFYDSCGDGCSAFDVQNGGTLAATNVEVYALNGYLGSPTNCQGFTIATFPAGALVNLDTFLSLFEDFYIIVDPDNVILESDKSNNTLCTGTFCTSPPIWPGDFNSCFSIINTK